MKEELIALRVAGYFLKNIPEKVVRTFKEALNKPNMADLPARKRHVNNGTTLEVLEQGQQHWAVLSPQKASVTIELADIDMFSCLPRLISRVLATLPRAKRPF